jgi:hypothetical protein
MTYYLSICCIIKNERYLEEFIIYHHIVGVEHFYIYDNNSDNPIKNRLNNFYFNRLCTIIDFPGHSQQIPAYQHCIKHFGNQTKWLAIIDGDEYILPKQDWSIRDVLNRHEDTHALGINWVLFGSSHYDNIQDGLLVDKYRMCENGQNHHIKSIVQPRYVTSASHPHFVIIQDPSKYRDCKKNVISGPFNNNYTIDLIRINHYSFKSLEDYIKKHHRGNADGTPSVVVQENHHSICNDIVDNFLPNKYLKDMKYYFKLAATNPIIYCALNKDISINYAYDHIFNYAQKENRPLHITDKFESFNKNIYRQNYPDLHGLNDEKLELHYINIGVNEGRICDRII